MLSQKSPNDTNPSLVDTDAVSCPVSQSPPPKKVSSGYKRHAHQHHRDPPCPINRVIKVWSQSNPQRLIMVLSVGKSQRPGQHQLNQRSRQEGMWLNSSKGYRRHTRFWLSCLFCHMCVHNYLEWGFSVCEIVLCAVSHMSPVPWTKWQLPIPNLFWPAVAGKGKNLWNKWLRIQSKSSIFSRPILI